MTTSGKSTQILALVAGTDVGAQVAAAVGTDMRRRLRVETGDAHDAAKLATGGVDIVLLEIDTDDESAVAALRRALQTDWRGIPVIAIARQPSVQQIRKLMHLGVIDVLPCPLNAGDIDLALDHAVQVALRDQALRNWQPSAPATPAAEPARGGAVVSALKAGGGVGATTLLVQGAAIVARRKRQAPRVAVLDLDVQFGNAALYLDLSPRSVGLGDLLEAPERLDAELLSGAMSHHDCGVDVLAAPTQMLPLDAITPEFAQALLAAARASYDLVLVDLPAEWTAWTYSVLSDSDRVLLVSQYTVSNIRRAARQVETLQGHEIPGNRVSLVMNRFDNGLFQGRRLREAEKAIGHAVDHCIPNDFEAAVEALNQGLPLVDNNRRHPVVKALDRLMSEIEPKSEPTVRVA